MTLYKTKHLLIIGVMIVLAISGIALTRTKRPQPIQPTAKNRQETNQTNDTLPLIISQVKDLEVVKAELKNKGTSDAYVVLEIKNKSDKGVVAVSVEIGKPEEAGGITLNGFKEDGVPPSVVIEPHGSAKIELPLNNAKFGDPIRVSGAVYADESEDGEKTALETIHSQRELHKHKRTVPEEGTSPQ